jgi:Uma2 family endonuclease
MTDLFDYSSRGFSIEEYFEIESNSEIRYEFDNGILIPLLGNTLNANEIVGNIMVNLRMNLRKNGFRLFTHSIRTIVHERRLYRYPDVVVSASNTLKDIRNVTEPVLVVEVLSESTEDIDRNKKFRQYTALPSLQYYLMIHQDMALIEFYQRKENSKTFEFNFFDRLSETINLPVLGTFISMEDIYEGIEFEEKKSE